MTPALLAKASPHLSLYPSDDPDPTLASPVVRFALTLAGQLGASAQVYNGTIPVVLVTAQADGPNGQTARRQAVVTRAGAGTPRPFHFLTLTNQP